MAELALSALAAAGTAGAASAGSIGAGLAASTTITTAAGVTTALGATSGLFGTLGTVATVGSMAASILGGAMAWRQSESQAAVAELNAEGAKLEASEKALRIRREAVIKVGQARVAFAGSGLDISSGSAIEAGYNAERDFEVGLAKSAGELGAASNRMQAESYRSRGRASLIDAATKAGGAYVNNAISIARRG